MKNNSIFIECKCGNRWWIDDQETPEKCIDEVWRFWIDGIPGRWVDRDGNTVK